MKHDMGTHRLRMGLMLSYTCPARLAHQPPRLADFQELPRTLLATLLRNTPPELYKRCQASAKSSIRSALERVRQRTTRLPRPILDPSPGYLDSTFRNADAMAFRTELLHPPHVEDAKHEEEPHDALHVLTSPATDR